MNKKKIIQASAIITLLLVLIALLVFAIIYIYGFLILSKEAINASFDSVTSKKEISDEKWEYNEVKYEKFSAHMYDKVDYGNIGIINSLGELERIKTKRIGLFRKQVYFKSENFGTDVIIMAVYWELYDSYRAYMSIYFKEGFEYANYDYNIDKLKCYSNNRSIDLDYNIRWGDLIEEEEIPFEDSPEETGALIGLVSGVYGDELYIKLMLIYNDGNYYIESFYENVCYLINPDFVDYFEEKLSDTALIQ